MRSPPRGRCWRRSRCCGPAWDLLDPDSALAGLGFGGQRLQYELSQFIPLLVLVAVGVGFYVLGRDTRRHMVSVPLIAHGDGALPAPAPG